MPRIPDSVRRSRNAAGARHQSGPPGASEPLPLGVAGGHQLRRLDDLGTMTAGHQLLHLDDLHTSSFARTESGRRPFRESYGLPSHPSTGNSQDRKSTRLNSSHVEISYAVFCLKKKITSYDEVEMAESASARGAVYLILCLHALLAIAAAAVAVASASVEVCVDADPHPDDAPII